MARSSIRLFKSPFLEFFSHVHPAVPLVLWGPLIAFLLWRSVAVHSMPLTRVAGLGIAGLFVWTLAEYALHRHVFHFRPRGAFQERVAFLIHGVHHADPNDATRLVMPPVSAIVLASALYLVFRAGLGPVLVEPFFALFLVGYLAYDYIHFYVHHFNPRSRLGKRLKRNHMVHHFAEHDAWWGVSSPLWDYVFGTAKRRVGAQRQ